MHRLYHLFALFLTCFIFALAGCSTDTKPKADAIYYNGVVYTLNNHFTKATAFAVLNGAILEIGSDASVKKYEATKRIDLNGKFVYPGLQDAHCHFYGYGSDLGKIWLLGTSSFDAILDTLNANRNAIRNGWIFGRGWDQNDWEIKSYPDKAKLDLLFPDTPVFLLRIDGHAALVNQKALDIAGISPATTVSGGIIEKRNGRLTGILLDAAVDIVYKAIPPISKENQIQALLQAQQDCFAVGLTSVTDAGIENSGLPFSLIQLIDSLQKRDTLKMRLNVMASPEEAAIYVKNGKIKTSSLSVQSFKLYADGALGSRGACLLEPYSDQPGHYGFLIHTPEYLDSMARVTAAMGFQLNTHCIGDSSHRLMLKIYEKYVGGVNDHRWRIEHAQVIHKDDIPRYTKNKIIPSVQPVHATSDMYWAADRLGAERVKYAYAYQKLYKAAGVIAAGSDFPVEHINPLFGYYAAIARKDQKSFPEGGFQKEDAMTREEALRAMTIWAAYAGFSENETGSLEKGKMADFVIFDEDLLTVDESRIYQLKVNATYVGGVKVFQRGK